MKKTIEVQNLKCGGCANTIITKLEVMDTITEVSINVETSKVNFNYTSTNNLVLAENKPIQLGYPPIVLDKPLTAKA